jgi:hypothetical protein
MDISRKPPVYTNIKRNNDTANIKSNKNLVSDKFIRLTKINYNLQLAERIYDELLKFLSEKGDTPFIFSPPKVMHHEINTHQKAIELIIHGDIKTAPYERLSYNFYRNKNYCDPNHTRRPENKLFTKDDNYYIKEEEFLIFGYLQEFIFKMYGVYIYDASKIMSNEKYNECAKEEQKIYNSTSEYLGIVAFCENTNVSIIFSRTELKLEDLQYSKDEYLWFKQPDNNFWFAQPGEYKEKQLECPNEFVEFFNQKLIYFEKLIDNELIHIKNLITGKMQTSFDIEESVFGANLICLSPEYQEKIKNFEIDFNLKFIPIDKKMFKVKLNNNSKVIIDCNYHEEISKDDEEKLKYVENLKNPNVKDDFEDYCEDDFELTEIDDEPIYPQTVVIDLFGRKEFEIHKNPAQVIYVDNKPYIVIENIAYEMQQNSPFVVGHMVNSDNSSENSMTIKSKNYVEIIIGSHREVFEISDLKLFSFENYCIGPNNKAYPLSDHARFSFF